MYNGDYPDDDRTVILSGSMAGHTRYPLTDHATPSASAACIAPRADDDLCSTTDVQPNPLLAAAAPLLSELVALRTGSGEREPIDVLRVTLEAGIRQFDQQCRHLEVAPASRQAARYVLCTALDEAILTTRWGNNSNWSSRSLLSAFHQETFGGEKFFLLLTRLSQDMARHIDMLELMLACLCLGFEGRYRLQLRGQQELEHIRSRLHAALQQYRSPPDMHLGSQIVHPEPSPPVRPLPGWVTAVATASCLTILFLGFNHYLEQHRNDALEPYLTSSASITAQPGVKR